jgi:hypothetical protein
LLLADTVALVTFAFGVGMAVEILVSGLTLHQSLASRLLAVPLNALTARPYGLYRDCLFSLAGGTRLRALALDTFAFASVMIPQYACVLWWVGAEPHQIAAACGSVLAISLVIGRLYGLYLVICRRLLP